MSALPGMDIRELTCTVEWWKNGEQIGGGDAAADGPLVEDDGSPGGDTAALFRDYGVTQSKD